MNETPWFHFRWMLRGFYIWPVRWQGWLLVAFAVVCAYGAFVLFALWPWSRPAFWATVLAVFGLLLLVAIRHAKADYPQT